MREASLAAPGTAAAHMPSLRTASILGIGTALPRRRVASEEIALRHGIDASWIHQRTGVSERRFAEAGESLTGLASAAAREALAAAGVEAGEVGLVLVASLTQDDLLPNAAPLVAGEIGADGAFACDLGAACTGFLSGLSLAASQVESGRTDLALVVGADLLSRVTDHDDRKTSGLFGDGAGAAVVGTGGGGEIERLLLRSDARRADCIVADHRERLIRMRGQDTFRAAVDELSAITREVLDEQDLDPQDVDLYVFHQANARITRAVGERLGLPRERVVDCIERLGNTSAATLPLALAEAHRSGMLASGDRVLLATFGAGLVWGGGLIRWDGEIS
ncbi:MAG: beta-ketoacyl-ACP synthase 3 [Solirubrobacterales bacterium]